MDGSLRPVKSDTDPGLSLWFKANSSVYLANNHACWTDADMMRKVHKRRFGNVHRSSVNGLTQMMNEHLEDVQKWITGRIRVTGDTTEDEDMG